MKTKIETAKSAIMEIMNILFKEMQNEKSKREFEKNIADYKRTKNALRIIGEIGCDTQKQSTLTQVPESTSNEKKNSETKSIK